jgi:hypothetical protein
MSENQENKVNSGPLIPRKLVWLLRRQQNFEFSEMNLVDLAKVWYDVGPLMSFGKETTIEVEET